MPLDGFLWIRKEFMQGATVRVRRMTSGPIAYDMFQLER